LHILGLVRSRYGDMLAFFAYDGSQRVYFNKGDLSLLTNTSCRVRLFYHFYESDSGRQCDRLSHCRKCMQSDVCLLAQSQGVTEFPSTPARLTSGRSSPHSAWVRPRWLRNLFHSHLFCNTLKTKTLPSHIKLLTLAPTKQSLT